MTVVINILVHISFLLSTGMILVVAWKCQQSQVRSAFLVCLAVMTLWNVGILLELDFRIITGITYMAFINICYIGICLVPVTVLYLGKVILHSDWHPKPVHVLFLIIPLISIAVVFTNPMHRLFFVNFSLYSSEAVYGIYYYFHSLYSYGCIAAGIVLMLIASARNSGIFSRQSLLVIFGVVITVLPNMMYSFGAGHLPFSISIAAFTLTMLCFTVAFLKYRFISSLPITLRQVVDLISDGYVVLDRQLSILSYNQALLRLFPVQFSITPGDHMRTFIEQYFLDNSYDRFLILQAQAVAQRKTVSAEAHIIGGTYVSVEITPVMQRNTPIGSIILLKDITQSKLLITASEAANRAKSEFLANMSHEIRTPMNAIIGMVAIGKSTANIERKNYTLAKIEDASKHLLGVINDILDMSKIEAGKFELSSAEYNFEKMIQRVADIMNFRIGNKRQKFMVYIDPDIPKILVGDDQRLAQVITNLLGNAVKFTPERGFISLKTRFMGEENGVCTIQLTVSDTGIGINPEQQGRLFQSFSQAESDTARNFGGTGLGLSISKNIVEMMGGKIWIESELGKGSNFIFTIKAKQGGVQKQEKTELNTNWKDIHILAVDDDPDILSYLNEIMRNLGISCEVALSGQGALQLVRQKGHYDIYFLNWKIPDISTVELTKQLKTAAQGNFNVVWFSAVEWSEIECEAKQAGVDKFLAKPLFPSDIAEIINECMGQEQKQAGELQQDFNGLFKGYSILLAEDIEINREIVLALLEPTLLQIDCAENGLMAVRMFSETPEKYDMIFMDVQMPEMDGYEATRRIRTLEAEMAAHSPERPDKSTSFTEGVIANNCMEFPKETPKLLSERPDKSTSFTFGETRSNNRNLRKQIPIIAMTANVFREDLQKSLDAGMDGHIGKPLEFKKLMEILGKFLPMNKAGAAG